MFASVSTSDLFFMKRLCLHRNKMEGDRAAAEEKTVGNGQENTDEKEENGVKDTKKEASKHSNRQKSIESNIPISMHI